MDPTTDEQLDYGDEEYGGSHKMHQYHGSGTIPALAEDEMMGEDDEYDDLYNDVNIGEGFLQLQRSEGPAPSVDAGNGNFQAQKASFPDSRAGGIGSEEAKIPGVATEMKYAGTEVRFPEQKSGPVVERVIERPADGAQNARPSAITMTLNSQVGNSGYQGSMPMPQKTGADPITMPEKNASEATPMVNSGPRVVPHMPTNQLSSGGNVNMNSPIINETPIRSSLENGNTMLFVGELHWWTTDAELEGVMTQYGKVKEIKFFDERASGKSKGYCQVEFFDPASAAACKEGMNGHSFNGRACVVAFATPQTIKQMGSSYVNKTQNQVQSQPQGRRPMNEGVGRGGANYTPGDAGRNFGRGSWGRGGPGMPNRGPGGGPVRGRGAMGSKNMMGNPGAGNGVGGAFGQGGLGGPAFGGPPAGLMHPQGMMGPGFDPGFMGRGGGYGGFSGPAFPGMMPPFPAVNPMGLPGVAPHVNPAFFGRGMAANGMGMMGTAGMDGGPHPGMWTDTSGGGWGGGEELGRRTRESSYGGEDNASEYGYGEVSHDKGARSSAVSREKERGSERDNSERRHRDEREHDKERYDNREHRYNREERDGYRDYRQKERESEYEEDYDRGQSSSRSRSRSRAVQEENHRSRSRDTNYGKRRRAPSE